ncbi:hypothetical protein [Streptomyces sp. NPDC055006]
MSVIALAGCSGSPGVTTSALALLLSWPLQPGRRMVLAECDLDGSGVLYGLLQGSVGDRYGLRNLSVASRKGELVEAFWRQLIDVSAEEGKQSPHNRLVLPGVTDPAQAAGLGPAWDAMSQLFTGIGEQPVDGHDVLIDLGRNGAFGPSAVLAQRSDALIVVVRNTVRSLQAAQVRIEALEERIGNVGVLMIDEGPYPVGEVQRVLRAPVVATLPYVPREARVLSDGAEQPRNFTKSPLMKAARSACTVLEQRVAMRRARLAPRYAGPSGGAVGHAG